MSDYLDELLQEVLGLFGFNSTTDIVVFLVQHNIVKFFDFQLRPLLLQNNTLDIPDLHELEHIVLTGVTRGIDSEEFRNAMNNINELDHERYLAASLVWAFIVAAIGVSGEETTASVHLPAYMMLQLMVAIWKYGMEKGDALAWGMLYQENHANNQGDASETDDSEDYETDDE